MKEPKIILDSTDKKELSEQIQYTQVTSISQLYNTIDLDNISDIYPINSQAVVLWLGEETEYTYHTNLAPDVNTTITLNTGDFFIVTIADNGKYLDFMCNMNEFELFKSHIENIEKHITEAQVDTKVSDHNISATAHNDLRLAFQQLLTKVNNFLDSDDVTLDQLSEMIEYIKDNRELIESITTNKVNVNDIVNDLVTNVSNKPLSAAQGVALKALIDAIIVPTKLSELSGDTTHRTVTDSEKSTWNTKSNFSGSYNDLTNKPTIPSKTSQLTNDSGFLTTGNIVQATGDSETAVMSQKAITAEIDRVDILKKDISAWQPVNILEDIKWGTQGTLWAGDANTPISHSSFTAATELTPAVPGATYKTDQFVGQIRFYDSDKKYGNVIQVTSAATVEEFTIPDDVAYFGISYQHNALTTDSLVARQKIWRTTISEEEYNALPARVDSLKSLYGKTVVCFGDSLFGLHRGDTSAPAHIANITGATVHNVGFGGCRMSDHNYVSTGYREFSMYALAKAISENNWSNQDTAASSGSDYFPEHLSLLKSIDFNKVDIAVIHYGTNDFGGGSGTPIDNASDRDDCFTLCGALRYSLDKLLEAYPHLRIYISLPVYRFWTDNGTVYAEERLDANGKKLPEFVEALRGVALEYNLPVIDGYYGLGINKVNASTYLYDGTHQNEIGRKRFGEFIGASLISQQNGCSPNSGGMTETEVTNLINSAIGDAIGGSY